MTSKDALKDLLSEINFTAVKSALAVLNEIAVRCNNFDEFKICLNETVNNLTEQKKDDTKN